MYVPIWESTSRSSALTRGVRQSRFPLFLVGLLLATAIPLSLLTYFSISIYTQDMTRRSEEGASAVADDSATFIQQQVIDEMVHADSDGERQVAPAMGGGGSASLDLAGINGGLSDIVNSKEGVDTAFATDLTGRALAIQPADPTVVGETFNDEDWFTGVLATQAPVITSISTIRGLLDPQHVGIASPLRVGGKDGGAVVGYLVAVFNLGFLQASVDDFQRRRGVEVTVLDHYGQVLVGFGPGAKAHE